MQTSQMTYYSIQSNTDAEGYSYLSPAIWSVLLFLGISHLNVFWLCIVYGMPSLICNTNDKYYDAFKFAVYHKAIQKLNLMSIVLKIHTKFSTCI